ncbi:MAG TPA: substrate-binding domain-containing protein, partial [Homoserinimonas sp.]|nr:substrate-binding domain-containing protein [Homoserinimonas sp.]
MTTKRWGAIAAVAVVGTLALSSCAANEGTASADDTPSTLSGTLVGGGASSMATAQEAWVAAFQTANPDVTVNYEPTGSGTGRENFLEGGSNFIGSDRAF